MHSIIYRKTTDLVLGLSALLTCISLPIPLFSSKGGYPDAFIVYQACIAFGFVFAYLIRRQCATRLKAISLCSGYVIIGAASIFLLGITPVGVFMIFIATIVIKFTFSKTIFLAFTTSIVLTMTIYATYVIYVVLLQTQSMLESLPTAATWLIYVCLYAFATTTSSRIIDRLRRHSRKKRMRLREQQNRLATTLAVDVFSTLINKVIQSLPMAVAWKDEQLIFQGANERYLKELSLPSLEALQQAPLTLYSQDEAEMVALIEVSLLNGRKDKYRFQQKRRRDDGTAYVREIRHIALRGINGDLLGIVVAKTDVLSPNEDQLPKDKADSAEEKLQIAKSQFLANISHDIRTPLMGIKGNLALLSNTQLIDKQQQYLSNAEQSITILGQVLSDLLDLAKIEAQELQIERKPFNIGELIHKTANTFRVQCEAKYIQFRLIYSDDDYPTFIGDVNRIEQVLVNLLSNAVKFTDEGQISFAVTVSLRLGSAFLRCRITDTGMGIDSQYLPSLFDSFSQQNSNRTRQHGGTGLGLAIVKQLVNKMNGDITVDSQLGRGSEFSFKLPLVISKRATDKQTIDDPHKKLRILLVEDNAINQEIAISMFGSANVTIDVAENGAEAVQHVKTKPFDIVLMDIQMPVMDGLAATIEIRKAFTKEALPIIAVTANVMESEIQMYYHSGFNAHIGKPYSKSSLLDTVRETVSSLIDRRTSTYLA